MAEARSRITEEFGASFFVEAAAGSRKTTALVRRIVGLISAGIGTLKRIVASLRRWGGQLLISRANGRLIPAAPATVFKALAVLDPGLFQYSENRLVRGNQGENAFSSRSPRYIA